MWTLSLMTSLNCYWISPQGGINPVETHHHGEFANKVLATDLNWEVATLTLAQQGWLHIGFSEFIGTIKYIDLPPQQAESLYKVLDSVTSGIVRDNIVSYIHS